jgi:DNA replication licensing factor MCM3
VEEGTPCHDNLAQPLSIDGPDTAADNEAVDTSPFEKYDPLLHMGIKHGTGPQTRSKKPKKLEILNIGFVKKYIQYAKSKTAPVLTTGAADYIVEVYANLRNEGMEGNKKKVQRCRERHIEFTDFFFSIDFAINGSYSRDIDSSSYRTCQSSFVTES